MGAAIAAVSQELKGICALFVVAASRIRMNCIGWEGKASIDIIFQCRVKFDHAIDIMIRASPNRFVRAVIIPEERAFGLW